MIENLADRIYEAAFVPDLWHRVLDDMVSVSSSTSGTMCIVTGPDRPPIYRTTSLTRECLAKFVATGRWKHSGRMAAIRNEALVDRISCFLYATDYMSEAQLETCGIEQSLREIGLGEQLHTTIPMVSGEFVTFTLERRAGEGRHETDRVTMMNALRPHLARAGLIAARLRLAQATATVTALQALGLPACILRHSGSVLAANTSFEKLDDLFVARAFGRLALVDGTADLLLQAAFEKLKTASARPAVQSIPSVSGHGKVAHVIHAVPLRRAAHDIFVSADIMLIVNRVDRELGIPGNVMVSTLFDLSPAEARLATHLATGVTLAVAAERNGITVKTARTYVERIFAKTGTHRQGELIALLRSVQSVGMPS